MWLVCSEFCGVSGFVVVSGLVMFWVMCKVFVGVGLCIVVLLSWMCLFIVVLLLVCVRVVGVVVISSSVRL